MGKIDKKQIIIITLIVAVAIIFVPVYFYVLADDSDANKIEIKSSSITNVIDGSLPFDLENSAGNDTSDNNGRIRTFDSSVYTINYKLGAKEDEEIDTSADNRTVILDVILPVEVEAKVSASASSESVFLNNHNDVSSTGCDGSEGKIVFNGKYRYAEFLIHDQGINSDISLNITISDIYSSNNQEFEPIFVIKESTDSNKLSIGELSCSELAGEFDNIRSRLYIISDCENVIGGINTCSLTVTGIEQYSVKLFTGDNKESYTSDVNRYPIGVLVTLDEQGDKGIKGSIIPSEVDINFEFKDSDNNPIDLSPNSYKTYSNSEDYTVYIDNNTLFEIPNLNNGTVTSSSSNNIHITGITNNDILSKKYSNYYYVSSNVFFVSYDRPTYDYADKTFTITSNNGGNTNITDTYGFTLGNYTSNVELYSTSESEKEEYGIANFNYNQDFYITTNFSYTSGDGITDLTNYLKIDNDAIDLTLLDNNVDYRFEIDSSKGSLSGIKFGYGEWNTDYFDLTNADGCPDTINSKEELMNLYGGPCVRETSSIKWVDRIGVGVTEEEQQRGVIIVKTIVAGDHSKNDLILPGTSASLYLKAKVKDTYILNNQSYQITSSATALGNGNFKYLGNINDLNVNTGDEIARNSNNFVKSGITSDEIIINRNTCNSESCAISGNSILVSGVKVSKPTVKFYRNNKETSNFYYYPIETRITANAYKNDLAASFETADIYVDMPSYMEYIDYDNSDTAKSPIEVTPMTINDISYNRYHYVFDSSEINDGEIDNLKVFTNISMDTPNGITPTIYVTANFTIAKTITNSNNESSIVRMSSIMPNSYRMVTDSSITLFNGSDITMQAVTTPFNMEKNGTYTYSMRAYNNSRNNGNELSYPNASLYYVVPYKGDSSYSDLSSDFEATGFKIKLNEALPEGYTIYYTKALASNIINEEITANSDIEWTIWNNPTEAKSNITGIKITKNSNFDANNYFIKNEGISLSVTPINSEEGDIYYNVFYIISDKPNNYECTENDEACSTTDNKKLYYSSSRTMTSIYNRKVSGFVFEDYDENGIYSTDESKLENIPVSLYKIDGDISNYDPMNPVTFVSENDELIAETITGSNGEYSFRGIAKGNYYVKFKYNDSHYIPTDNSIINPNIPGSVNNNSKASILPNTDIAISNIISFSGNTTEFNSMNLGLKIKKEFKVEIKKYITNVQIISDGKVENHDFNNSTRVSLNIRNPKNAKIKVKYGFYVENIKYYPGYVGMIVDAVPEGMTFNPNLKENQDWVYYDGNLYYNGLSGAILLPNQKIPFSLVLETELTKGGNYVNSVSVKDLTLMGDELPKYDFNALNVNLEGGE